MRSDGMGSKTEELMTLTEAAATMRVSVKTVQNYMKRGLLTPIYKKDGVNGHLITYFQAVEVYAVASTQLEEYSLPKIANNAARALALAQHTNKKLDSILELLGVSSFSIPFDEEGVQALYFDAQDKAKLVSSLGEEGALYWSRVFTQLSEEYFDLIVRLSGEEQPWKAFLQLGEKLAKDLANITSLTVDKVKVLLGASRRHLRNTAYFYVRSREGFVGVQEKTGKYELLDEEIIKLMFIN